MKTVAIGPSGGLEHLQILESDEPTPGPGEVLVRWHATSLNFHDYLVGVGAIPVPEGRIPMSDGAGEIVALGEGVDSWQVGDHVMSLFFPNWLDGQATAGKTKAISGETVNGFLTEYDVASAASLTRIPNGYSFAEAATLPCAALTAWRALVVEGQMKMGDTVLIEGSGGMSIFALQLAKAAGATVYATSSSAAKADRLREMGAVDVLDYKTDERWGKTIFRATGGMDHVLDVGGGSTMNQSIEAAAMGGHIYAIGILGNGRKGTITFPKLFFKHLKLTGLAVGSRKMQEEMIRGIEEARIRPVIDRTFGFTELAAAFEYQASGAHFGKIVLEY
ncbi:MAG: NAD(P)-dependent alcohol dehydrogenase [Bacteroidota bacterium]